MDANYIPPQQGITHAFVMEFDNTDDRDYYATKDPIHIGTVKTFVDMVDKLQVIDFTKGVFK